MSSRWICKRHHFAHIFYGYFSGIGTINTSHKSQPASDKYPTMHHFVTEMCTHVHISVTNWCILGYSTGALWDLWNRSRVRLPKCQWNHRKERRGMWQARQTSTNVCSRNLLFSLLLMLLCYFSRRLNISMYNGGDHTRIYQTCHAFVWSVISRAIL